jgi:hypothetical protein
VKALNEQLLMRLTLVATFAVDNPVISAMDAASSCSRYSSKTCRSSGLSCRIKSCNLISVKLVEASGDEDNGCKRDQ